MSKRVILHCDCNSFFASVETVLNPEYLNVPMAVCGSQSDRHGIVLAKNELAKQYGVKTAETVYSAKKKCPMLVIASPHYDEYVKYSELVNKIYSKYTDMIEPFGIDESWLDVTASRKLFGNGNKIADMIRSEVKSTLGITISVGVSFNKVFAKLASDYKKPDAVTVFDAENFKTLVFPQPVSSLLFVGKKTEKEFSKMGIRTIGDLANTPEEILVFKFGKLGSMLHRYANGLDDTPVVSTRAEAKSISNGFTFRHDLVSREECRIGIDYLSEEIGAKLRSKQKKCSTVSVSIKDEHLHTIQRQRPQNPPTDISRDIAKTAFEIVCDEWSENRPIRMITLSVSNLIKDDGVNNQITLFDDAEKERARNKNTNRENAIDIIRQKYGNASILNGAVIDSDIGFFTLDASGEEK